MVDVESLEAFFRLMNANGAVWVYREALKSGVLAAVVKKPGGLKELAGRCGVLEGPLGLMLEVLGALGLVKRVGEGEAGEFWVTPLGMVLMAGSYQTLGDLYWGHLGEFLRTGVPMARMDDVGQSEGHYAGQAQALAWMSGAAAECAAKVLVPMVRAGGRILDVGAGSGIWSLVVAGQVSGGGGAKVTAVDWAGVLAVAQKFAGRMGMAERLACVAGNYHEVELEAGAFDLAVMANVLHLETEDGCRGLLRRVWGALKPGGHVAVIDVMGGQAAGELNKALYALGLALRTERGQVYEVGAIKGMLAESGFGEGEVVKLEVVPWALGMVVARRVG